MPPNGIPSHILIVGSGVFGLSTAYALTQRHAYRNVKITLISPDFTARAAQSSIPVSASIDTNRIIRADYADPLYAELAREAQALWRTEEWGGRGRYHECGLLITGDVYVEKSLANQNREAVRVLNSREEIADAMRAGSHVARGTGDRGYINYRSGWADAGGSLQDLEAKLRRTGRCTFVGLKVAKLLTDHSGLSVCGVELEDESVVEADLTVLATGAWTAALLDIRGIASCTAQVVQYLDLTEEEASQLSQIPVHLNVVTGCFTFPPNRKANGGWEIKVARHAFGYSNPEPCRASLGAGEGDYHVSLPSTSPSIPGRDQALLSAFLEEALPILGPKRQPSKTRLCHYSDTHTGDFLIGHHPSFGNLFVATGDSGHGFKFLPVLGERIVNILAGGNSEDVWTRKWAFPKRQDADQVWCEDGSRGGQRGVSLTQTIEKANLNPRKSRI